MNSLKRFLTPFATLAVLAACTPAAENPQDAFFNQLAQHCGKSYQGQVVAGDPETDKTWIESRIVIEVKACTEDQIYIPLHVGDDHSRTWIITRTEEGLSLKHDHRFNDGSLDPITNYGGHTVTIGTAVEQAFPADDFSKTLFVANEMGVSVGNTWVVSFPTENAFRYQLVRDNRDFQVEIDLSQTVEAPPAPWGWPDLEKQIN